MKNRLVLWSAFTAVLLAAAPVMAQTPAGARPDLSGIWSPVTGTEAEFFAEPAMTAWAQKKYDAVRFGVPEDEREGGQGIDFMDPVQACYPNGPSRQLLLDRPIEIFQQRDRVILLYEFGHERRFIYMDGRGHPPGIPPTFMGHSIGRWDGDTLHVDTVGLRTDIWMDGKGAPLTDQMRYEENFRLLNPTTLEIGFRFEDPGAYTKPWGGKRNFYLKPDWVIMEQINCEDYLRERLDAQRARATR